MANLEKKTSSGWPWLARGAAAPPTDPQWPKISLVTPSYNQAGYLEETLLSVLGQGYPNLEYVIMEDGSTDGSPKVLESYRNRFAEVVAGPNRGFGAVLNDGLQRTTGEIMAWLNSDDLYLPGALTTVASVFRDCPEIDWVVGHSLFCNHESRPHATHVAVGFGKKLFFSGRYLGGHPSWGGRWIPQESVFWRRRLWDKAGGRFLQERLQYGDFELWSRFWKHARICLIPVPLGVYRVHPETYTSIRGNKSVEPCRKLIESAGEPRWNRAEIRAREWFYRLRGPFRRWCGENALVAGFDLKSGRWLVSEEPVL